MILNKKGNHWYFLSLSMLRELFTMEKRKGTFLAFQNCDAKVFLGGFYCTYSTLSNITHWSCLGSCSLVYYLVMHMRNMWLLTYYLKITKEIYIWDWTHIYQFFRIFYWMNSLVENPNSYPIFQILLPITGIAKHKLSPNVNPPFLFCSYYIYWSSFLDDKLLLWWNSLLFSTLLPPPSPWVVTNDNNKR